MPTMLRCDLAAGSGVNRAPSAIQRRKRWKGRLSTVKRRPPPWAIWRDALSSIRLLSGELANTRRPRASLSKASLNFYESTVYNWSEHASHTGSERVHLNWIGNYYKPGPDTPSDIRLLRRITRDIRDRGRTLESVTEQYLRTVRPMHEEFVEPSKRYADVIIPEGGYNEIAIDMVSSRIRLMQEVFG